MSNLEVNYDDDECECNRNGKCCDPKYLEEFLKRIEKTSILSKDWKRALAYTQIIDLKFCKDIRKKITGLDSITSTALMDMAVNIWYKLPSCVKQRYREADLMEPNTLQMKLQQDICDINLNKNNKLLNLYTWFVAEYLSQNEHGSLEEKMIEVSKKFQSYLEDNEIDEKNINNMSNIQIPVSMKDIYQKIHNKTAAYTCFIYGPSYKNFYMGYAQFRHELSKAEATRHALCFWSQLPKEIKSRFTNENDLTAAPSLYTLCDHMKWCDGGLHIGIKSVSYYPGHFLKRDTYIINKRNNIMPTSANHNFTFKQFFAVKRACIKWLNN